MELKRIDLTTNTVVDDEAPWAWGIMQLPPDTWADLSERGYPGVGYWPVLRETPSYDPTTQHLGADVQTVDAERQAVVLTREVVETPPVVVVPPDPPPTAWLIDIGPFFDRFGDSKLPALSCPDTTVQAIVKDVMARKWVDLERTDVAQALQYMVSQNIAGLDAELVTSILATPVSDEENRALRRMFF